MQKQILYRVGNVLCIDLKDPTKVIAFGELQNLTVSFSSDSEEIHGGDDPYPIAEFPKTRSITVSAQNATFNVDVLEFSQGAKTTKVESPEMHEIINYTIPENGVVKLPYEPIAGSIAINGYTDAAVSVEPDEDPVEPEADPVDPKKQFTVTAGTITFDKSQANEIAVGYYIRKSTNPTTVTSGYKSKFPKPFKFVHRMPIYNTDNIIVQEAQLTIYKGKSDNTLELSHAPQTAYAPQLSIKALDPKRPDGKLWDYQVEDTPDEDALDGNLTV